MKAATIAIIGAGNMGKSLIGGLIQDGHPADHIWASDVDSEKLAQLKQHYSIHTTQDNVEAIKKADAVIFSVKPQHIIDLARNLTELIRQQKPLLISIAAGICTSHLEHCFQEPIAIVRAMPNTPALIGCGATALYANSFVTDQQHQLAESILRAVGLVIWLQEEASMDTVTALSGSGPAYFFLVMEALQKAAEKLGLSHESARLLTLQTALGAARMAIESGLDLEELRKQVTSKGGTTEKGISVLEEKNIRDIFLQTVKSAKLRSEELANVVLKENHS